MVSKIKEQGGLVYATHPLARDVPRNIGKEALVSIIGKVDIIEGFNARIRHQSDNENAKKIAPFSTPQELLENLRQAQIFGRRTPYIFAGLTYLIWCARRFLKRL